MLIALRDMQYAVADTIVVILTTTLFAMLRFIISTAFFLTIGLLSYNYFFGTAEEKEQAQEIFSKGAEVVGAGAGLLKSEYQKYQEGKYDEALENVSHLLSRHRTGKASQAPSFDSQTEGTSHLHWIGRPGDGRHPLGPPLRRQMAQDAQRVNQCADRPGRGGLVAHEGRSSFGMPFSIEKN